MLLTYDGTLFSAVNVVNTDSQLQLLVVQSECLVGIAPGVPAWPFVVRQYELWNTSLLA